jgi:hypothetical protein
MSDTQSKVIVIESVVVATVVAAALLLQLFAGSFPLDIFAFPLNIITLVLWVVAAYLLFKNRDTSALAKSLLSIRATWLSLGSMAAIGIYLGLQSQPNSTSWLVVAGILFTLTHLLLITMRGWRTPQGIRWRFTLLHAGLIIALGAGFWGSPDREQLRALVTYDRTTTHAYHLDGTATTLDYKLGLEALDAEYNDSGMPTHLAATLNVDNKSVTLAVNHPYDRTFAEKIYLVSVDPNGAYCVVEIVREPWQWASLAGIILLLTGAAMLFIRGPRHTANKHIE